MYKHRLTNGLDMGRWSRGSRKCGILNSRLEAPFPGQIIPHACISVRLEHLISFFPLASGLVIIVRER